MKILVTGGAGQIAYALSQQQPEHIKTICLVRQICDISDPEQIHKALTTYQPQWVVNCAAYTAVDRAEQEQERAMAVNHLGAANLARACEKFNIPLCHISSDYVFNGEQNNPYKENDPTNPCNTYGLTKQLGEVAVQHYCKQAIILRVSSVFGCHGHNFVKTILRLSKQHQTLPVVSDQYCCPTSARDIALTIYNIINQATAQACWGIYHYASTPKTSWHAFATEIITTQHHINTQLNTTVIATKAADYPTAAKRPSHSVLSCDKIQQVFNIEQTLWQPRIVELCHELS